MSVIATKMADGSIRVVGQTKLGYVNVRFAVDGKTVLSGGIDLGRPAVKPATKRPGRIVAPGDAEYEAFSRQVDAGTAPDCPSCGKQIKSK